MAFLPAAAQVTICAALAPPPLQRCNPSRYDRVLVDAPCSGVGAWRRNPDARWLRRTRPLEELLPVQADVLPS